MFPEGRVQEIPGCIRVPACGWDGSVWDQTVEPGYETRGGERYGRGGDISLAHGVNGDLHLNLSATRRGQQELDEQQGTDGDGKCPARG